MFEQQLSCAACGERLSATATVCPRCGALRSVAVVDEPATGNAAQAQESEASPPMNDADTRPRPGAESEKATAGAAATKDATVSVAPHLFYIAPAEEKHREWRFCPERLKRAAGVTAFLLLLGSMGAGYWWNTRKEEARQFAALQQALARQQQQQPALALPETPVPLPTPTPVDDQTLAANLRLALTNYNLMGAAMRYKYEVRDGVVTLAGEAENQAEKDGVENVVKAVSGVKAVVNTMTVKNAASADQIKVASAPKLSEAEAKRLEEILNKEQAENQRRAEEERRKQEAQRTAEQEAERRRREEAAAKLREEEAALRRQAEERLRQEAAEYERRQAEQRRLEQERRARIEQARLEAGTLRTGTVAWSGIVSGIEEVVITGASASVRHVSGEPVREARASFSAPVPRAPVSVKLLASSGRVPVKIVQEPSAANGYTTIVRVGDGEKGGKRGEFTLKWSAQ